MEEEAMKDQKGHRSRYYESWVRFTASACIDEWSPNWDQETCREELVKEGHIIEGVTKRGRNEDKKRATASSKHEGDIMGLGWNGDKDWFRNTEGGMK